MASSPVLHPAVRTRQEPRVSTTALAEYLILRPNGQQNILHDSKFSRPPIITANGEAMRALRAYNRDPKRSKDTLFRVKAALTTKAAGIGIKPKAKDEALRCVEIIEMFERGENALGMRAMQISEPPNFDTIEVEGVMISIRPDFLVGGGAGRVGAAMLRVAKAPDPADCKKEDARDRRQHHRRELAHYLVALMQMLLDEQDGALGIPDRDLCFVADIRLGERIGPASDHAVRLRDIRSACGQIQKLWSTVEAKPYLWKQ